MKRLLAFCLLLGCLLMLAGFNIDNAIVPKDEILSGGPPKDGIPAILDPHFIRSTEAEFLEPDDGVIGVQAGGEVKAYPIKILNWHEVVNDTIGGVPIVVTF
ncbi:MAG: DUF3179 domain-containing protein [Proteobacteria bacterium]|nr:DUF3179 domain-containing protein [Pseudomonadota bacterium]